MRLLTAARNRPRPRWARDTTQGLDRIGRADGDDGPPLGGGDPANDSGLAGTGARPGQSNGARDGGMVTAELAVALPALVAVLVLALAGVTAATAQLRCIDGAREAARAAARGEPDAVARAAATREAPRGSIISIQSTSNLVTVTVHGRAGSLGVLPGLPVSGQAVADKEPGIG